MITIRKTLLALSVSALLTAGSGTFAADMHGMEYSPMHNAEVGMHGWSYGAPDKGRPSHADCSQAGMATSPAIGPVAWNWWEHTPNTPHPESFAIAGSEMNSEVGHIGIRWWTQTEMKHSGMQFHYC